MAYAAYRDHRAVDQPTGATIFKVLEVVVPSIDAFRVRRSIATCEGAGIVRSEPIVHASPTFESVAARVRLLIRLPIQSYTSVVHCLLECAPEGEIGCLSSWRDHLRQHGVVYGG
jgi:hypothetical protein